MKEYFLSCWHLILLSFGMGVAAAPAARAADITFNVNLHYQAQQGNFTPGTDAVRVTVGSSTLTLTDADNDRIYSGVLTGQQPDAQLAYRYSIVRGGSPSPEAAPARKYVVQETSAANVLDDWYNNDRPNYPYADFYVSSVKTIQGEVVRLFDSSDGAAATSWRWRIPGATVSDSTAQNPTAYWTAAGTYQVRLVVTNGTGVRTAKTMSITVVDRDNLALSWWNDQVFYQLFPRSFLDTDGDGIGDLQGMINKLDYLSNELGVTALYIMPIYDASRPYFGGYEITNYKSVSAEFGGDARYDQFVDLAHRKGMRVIMDMVFNHSSKDHPWYKSAGKGAGEKYDDYYRFRASGGSNWRPNPVAHSNPAVDYVWDKFTADASVPDLNFNSASVRNAVKDVSSYWLTTQLADGFRLDAPKFLYETGDLPSDEQQQNQPATYAYWRSWNRHVKATNSAAFSVGETWEIGNIPGMAKYVYQGMDIGFQFDIALGVEKSLNSGSKTDLQTAVEQTVKYYPFLQYGVFTSNHDLAPNGTACGECERRIKDRLTGSSDAVKDAKAKVAAAFVLTAPGVPFIYFGEEVGAGGDRSSRTPMHWDASAQAGFTSGTPWYDLSPDYPTYNVASEKNDPGSIWGQYKQLIAVRKAQVALRQGKYTTMSSSDAGVYAYARTSGAETVLVILNLATSAKSNVSFSVTLPNGVPTKTYSLSNLLGGPAVADVPVSNSTISNWVPLGSLPANAYYVLKLNATAGPNAAPTLAAIAAQALNLEDGAKAVGLTGVSDGDYCNQTLTGSASSSNAAVVSGASVSSVSCTATTATLTLTPAAAGTSTITVTLTDNGGTAGGGVNTTSRSFTATVTDVPRAPTGLALSQVSPTSIKATWTDNSARETGYRIYWSTSATKPTTAGATVGASVSTYTATGLSTQTTYNFWVEAYSANGSSAAATATLALTLPNLALNKPAKASNVETYQGVTYAAALAVDDIDNSFTNRWSAPVVTSAGNDQKEWLRIDLGAVYNLSRVRISWENANADAYYLMASSSDLTPDPANSAWSKLSVTGKPNQSRLDDQPVSLTGRYLAVYCTHKSQPYGYSIYELQAYGLAATGNQPPSASAGPNQTLPYTATSTTLDASGSTDPEGSPLTYAWSKVSGAAATFSSTTAARPTVSGLTVGAYTFQVSVSDGALTSTAQVTVTVQANQAPTANAGPDQSLAAGTTTATLTAAASTDPEGKPLTYSWSKVSGGAATFSSTTAVSPTVSGLAAGTYVFQVSVSDGALSSTDQVQITVASSSGAPSYYLINRWKGTYLADNGSSQVTYVASTTANAAQWTLEPVAGTGYVRIRNVGSGNYMNVENLGANVQCTNVPSSFTSSQWAQEAVAGTSYYRIRNNWQSGAYVHVENQTGFAQYGAVDGSFYSGHWTFQATGGTGARPAASPLAATAAAGAPGSLTVFPNPVTAGRLTVLVPGAAITARVRLYDGQGRLVLSQTAALTAGRLELDVARCSAGLYLLQVEADGTAHTQKVLVQ